MSEYLVWFLIGIAFLIAEFFMPTFIMFFFGIGAWIVSIITACFNLSFNFQIILFILSSIISLGVLRNYLRNIFIGNETRGEDKYFDNSIDENENIATVTKSINPNNFGEIKYKGTFYKAQSTQIIDAGKQVKVIQKGNEQGTFFIVEENN